MAPQSHLHQLLQNRRVLLFAGCGGVGKTTTCAAAGLAAARAGKRVLCLTIDPARRLAQSLGIKEIGTEAQRIEPSVFEAAGEQITGSLTLMMLDTKSTFDSLVETLATSPEHRESIFNNVLYQYISSSLAGTQEYMAMEKLYEVKDDERFDIVMLDTPPTSHALDFLDAPVRLVDAIDSAAVRWFLKAFKPSSGFSLNLLQKSAAVVLRGIGRITGGGFLEQVASFITEMNDTFGGWRTRADEVSTALRGDDVGYVLVTTPDPMAIREVLYFSRRLRELGTKADIYVVNRVHEVGDQENLDTISEAIARRDLQLDEGAAGRICEAARHERRLGELDQLHLVAIEEVYDDDQDVTPVVVQMPEFPLDIHDVHRLAWVADVLESAN